MGKPYSLRPVDSREKMYIAQIFAFRLRCMFPSPLRIFLVGSVADRRDGLYSDVDVRVIHSGRYGGRRNFEYAVQNLAQRMYLETGVWIDAKTRRGPPFPLPGRKVIEI